LWLSEELELGMLGNEKGRIYTMIYTSAFEAVLGISKDIEAINGKVESN
jgi:hypothetical protein